MKTSLLPLALTLPLTTALGAGCVFDPEPIGDDAGGSTTDASSDSDASTTDDDDDPSADSAPSDDGPPADDGNDGSSGSDDGVDACGGACDHGTCSALGVCECEPGFEGDTCSVDIDDCVDVDCGQGTCIDDVAGFACACEPGWEGDACDALQMPLCLRGSLTVTDALDTVNGYVATGAFEHLEFSPVDLSLVFEVGHSYQSFGSGDWGDPEGSLTTIETANLSVESDDPFLDAVFGADFHNTEQDIVLVNGPTVGLTLGNMVSPSSTEYWGLETSSVLPLPLSINEMGFPAILPSPGDGGGTVILRRYQSGTPLMTDFAYAQWEPALLNGDACL